MWAPTTKPSAGWRRGHLIERGCRRIAHIAGQQRPTGAGRLSGYREALRAASLPFDPTTMSSMPRRRDRL